MSYKPAKLLFYVKSKFEVKSIKLTNAVIARDEIVSFVSL